MDRLEVSATFLMRGGVDGTDRVETLVSVSAVRDDGTPWFDWSSVDVDVRIGVTLSVLFGPLWIPLPIVAEHAQSSGFRVFAVEAPADLGITLERAGLVTLGIEVSSSTHYGQCLACACGRAHAERGVEWARAAQETVAE